MAKNHLLQHIQVPPFNFHLGGRFRRERKSRPTQAGPMQLDEATKIPEEDVLGSITASSPYESLPVCPESTHQSSIPFCVPEDSEHLLTWEPHTFQFQTAQNDPSQSFPSQQDLFAFHGPAGDDWSNKTYADHMDMQEDSDMTIGQAFTTDEHTPLDLRYSTPIDGENNNDDVNFDSKRYSDSSFALSVNGAVSDVTAYEDFSTTVSEAFSWNSEYPTFSNRTSLLSTAQLSPVASPRVPVQNRYELVRTQSRGRATPSPRHSMRAVPYSMDATRSKRWSTGSYAPARRPSSFVANWPSDGHTSQPQPMPSFTSYPIVQEAPLPLNLRNLHSHQSPPVAFNNKVRYRNSIMLPSNVYPDSGSFDFQAPILPLFPLLQSNADPTALPPYYADRSDPPELYASLQEEQLNPPVEYMNPDDPDMVPHEQELRFDGDLYTPKWVRGHGNKREGWCGICKPGRWLVLKNSAFWYDKSFTHGISAATGTPFQEPQDKRRMDGNPDVWEGLCGSCHDWIALVSSKKKGTTWFRHAYKCHSHPKIKDAPKRRRESSHARSLTAAVTTKAVPPPPSTPLMTPSQSVASTPADRKRGIPHDGFSPMI